MAEPLDQMSQPLGLRRLGYAGTTLRQRGLRWSAEGREDVSDEVAEEIPVALVYNGIPHVVMMATPADLEDFAVGFSLTEELIGDAAEVTSLEVHKYSLGVEVHQGVPDLAPE